MIIRPATPADLSDICALHIANWREDYAGVLPDDVLGQRLSDEMHRRWSGLPAAPDCVLLAEQDGQFLGFGLVRPGHVDGPLLESLHVVPHARGLGAGRALITALVGMLRAEGHASLSLEVLDGNPSARGFYAHLGGVEGPVITDELLGRPVPARIVRWPDLDVFPEIA